MTKINISILAILLSLALTSCVRTPVRQHVMPVYTRPIPVEQTYSAIFLEPTRHDTYHTVAPSETLWRISKMYDVTVEDILRANNLKDPTSVAMGQRLRIPNAAPLKPVVGLYPSNKWKYIIIHHSATDEGSALAFNKFHQSRGWENIGYHFVIDNGTEGKEDGQIEVAPRWIKQQDGAHCKAGGMNSTGIGICLVGNFSKEKITKKQLESLVYLVNTLREYYKIPVNNIMGHSEVSGASTECPGKKFPWSEYFFEDKIR